MRAPLVSIILATVLFTGCTKSDHGAAGPKAPTPVRVRVVEQRAGQSGVRYSGTIEPATRVDLAFKVGGYIRELAQVKGEGGATRKVQEGDFVKKGTLLASVRESDYQQRLTAAEAQVAEALASQKSAQLELDKSERLVAGQTMSQTVVDTTKAQLELAQARVAQAKSKVGEASLALGDTSLRAPIDGVILKRPIEVGSLVAAGSLGFVIADTTSVKVVFGVPDVLVEKMRLGSAINVGLEAVAGDFAAKITRVAPSADSKSRVFEIEATIPNPKDQLKVGMVASLKLPAEGLTGGALVLPLTAVVRSPRDPRGFAVYVVEGEASKEVARQKDVKLGEVIGNVVFVTDGLKSGERVVSMGATLVNDGDAIRVIP